MLTLQGQRPFNIFNYAALIHDEDSAIEAATSVGLIPTQVQCHLCGGQMTKMNDQSKKLGYRWRCRGAAANAGVHPAVTLSPLHGTFFENSKLPILKVMRLLVCFYFRTPVTDAIAHAEVASHTAVDFYNFFREAIEVVTKHDEEQVGSATDIVEVDESHLFTRKYGRGRDLRWNFWVFGGISRLNKKRFICQIENKRKNTLWPLMQQHIAQDTFIMSDEHQSYVGCAALGFKGHAAVNHTHNYVRPIPQNVPDIHPGLGRRIGQTNIFSVKVHDNTTENMWKGLKTHLRGCREPEMIPGYISWWLYRFNTLKHIEGHASRFKRLIEDIIRVYPGPNRVPIKKEDCECENCE